LEPLHDGAAGAGTPVLGEDCDAADVGALVRQRIEQEAARGDRFADLAADAGEVHQRVNGLFRGGGISIEAVDLFVLGDMLLIDKYGAADLEGVCHLLEGCDPGGVQLDHAQQGTGDS
jgi:hypothetical protein